MSSMISVGSGQLEVSGSKGQPTLSDETSGTRTRRMPRRESALVRKPRTMNLVINISRLHRTMTMMLMLIVSNCQANDNGHRHHGSGSRSNDAMMLMMMAEPAALVYSGGEEKPRLIPLVAAESGYSENSSVNILCTVSQGHHDTLTFDWFKDGQLLAWVNNQHAVAGGDKMIGNSNNQLNEAPINEFNGIQASSPQPPPPPQIEKHSDHSLLRISRVQSQHSGRYTCSVKNQFGQDSSSVNLIVNVKLQWIKEPPKEVVVSVNQELKVDCLAQGEPKPSMRWEKLDSTMTMMPRFRGSGNNPAAAGAPAGNQFQSHTTTSASGGGNADGIMMMPIHSMAKNQLATKESNGYKLAQQQQQQNAVFGGQPAGSAHQNSVLVSSNRHLTIQRAKESDAGIYECVATNSHDADLRKLVHVQVRGPPKILPIATADSYPEGSSINLICTVSGGQRRGLALSWTMDGQELDDQRLKYSGGLFDNLSIGMDDADISILRIRNATNSNSGQYTCTAKNPLGQDSTSVKIIINVELKWNKIPRDVEVGLNQELSIECDAVGQPKPTIEWFKHSTQMDRNSNGTMMVSKSNILKLSKAQHKDSGLYECVAKNGVDDDLRKVIQVKVRGK